ncbi:MAG TPA: VOC family protein [Iamia sp.]|nr:VOC family protein [Iamia sp.]
MKTLFPGLRVTDLDTSLAFYQAVGWRVLGLLDIGGGARLAALGDPGGPEVVLELVHRPDGGPIDPGGLDHLAVQVDDLEATVARLAAAALEPGAIEQPGGADGPRTAWLTDPDGYRVELVQWPAGHSVAMTETDFPQPTQET